MTFITKPKVAHPSLPKNALGFTRRDYEGALSTLCAGCGHDSITAAIVDGAECAVLIVRNAAHAKTQNPCFTLLCRLFQAIKSKLTG